MSSITALISFNHRAPPPIESSRGNVVNLSSSNLQSNHRIISPVFLNTATLINDCGWNSVFLLPFLLLLAEVLSGEELLDKRFTAAVYWLVRLLRSHHPQAMQRRRRNSNQFGLVHFCLLLMVVAKDHLSSGVECK